ncbi:proline-rich protein 19 [Anolis carolinensis]|uniref:proline-rich protein 19 n=1 Tax=Anolis carolinensis TaxID=28377 RepID=UPI002F2B6DEC
MNPSRQRERRSFASGRGAGDVPPLRPTSFQPQRGPSPLPPTRVKRRRSRRERNGARFGRGTPDADAEPVSSSSKGLPKKVAPRPPFWGSQLRPGAHSTPIGGAKAVVITQHRLTHRPQHWGIFNREVKSADIERLLSPRTGPEVAVEVTPECGDKETVQEEEEGGEVQLHHSCKPNPLAAEDATEAAPQLSVTPAALEVSPQDMEVKTVGEKKNVPPVAGGIEPTKGQSLAKELAQDLQRLLDLQALFPGRSVVSEAQQAVARALREQRKAWPDMDALDSLRRTLVSRGGSSGEALRTGLRSPSSRDRGPWPGSRPGHCGSGDSEEPGLPLRKRRGQEETFLAGFPPSPSQSAARMAAEGPDQREQGLDSFLGADASFPSDAVNPLLLPRSASPQRANPFRIPLVSDEPREAGLPLSQGSSEAFWGHRGLSERLEAAASPRKAISRWRCLPFAARHSLDLSHLDANGSDPFLSTEPPGEERNPDVMWFCGTEPAPSHGSRLPDLGSRNPDSQTSFDVLKSIWSPETAAEGPTPPRRSLLGRRFPSSQEWQPKEFLQLYSLVPEPNGTAFLSRPNPQPEATGNDFFLALAKPRTHSAEPTWGLAPPTEGGHGDDLERLLRRQGSRQHLQACQRLPMSCFPPSEALEEGRADPSSSFQGHLLDQASPEPWAFPRMKLY